MKTLTEDINHFKEQRFKESLKNQSKRLTIDDLEIEGIMFPYKHFPRDAWIPKSNLCTLPSQNTKVILQNAILLHPKGYIILPFYLDIEAYYLFREKTINLGVVIHKILGVFRDYENAGILKLYISH